MTYFPFIYHVYKPNRFKSRQELEPIDTAETIEALLAEGPQVDDSLLEIVEDEDDASIFVKSDGWTGNGTDIE